MKPKKSSRDWHLRINDILASIDKIERYTQQFTLPQFKKNELVVDAVIRNFEIIGEASKAIPLSIQNSYPEIPWKQMVEMRNFLIHEYSGVDIDTVWQTIHKYLPPLKAQLEMILKHMIEDQ